MLLGGDGVRIGWTRRFGWTGDNNQVTKDPVVLNKVQDEVFANKSYWPTEDVITFCNLSTQDVLRKLGYTRFDDLNVGGDNPFTADEMYAYIVSSDDWLIKPMADAIELVQVGTILVATLPAVKLGQNHGHICTCTPAPSDFSGHWNMKTVNVMNLGRAGTCFRQKGVNYAFVLVPEIYALVSTL